MAKTSVVYARIDTNLKESAEALLAKLGITPSALIQMTYSQVLLRGGLPFDARIAFPAPKAIEDMTQEELNEKLRKSLDSFKYGSYTADEVDRMLKEEFGI